MPTPGADVGLALVGRSPALRTLLREAERAAEGSDHPILIVGPIGAGKSLLARHIHAHSARAKQPLHRVDCGTLSDLDDLFGHRRGSFTGATEHFAGRLRAADGGVIVLDDVERLRHQHQDQLHQVVVDGRYYTVGTAAEVRVDVRFVATTNKEPEAAMQEGLLKRDFLSRLRFFELRVPSLAERREDIPALCEALLERQLDILISRRLRSDGSVAFAPGCLAFVQELRFDDNVRSLEWLIARVLAQIGRERDVVTVEDVGSVWPQSNGPSIVGASEMRLVRAGAERKQILSVLKEERYNLTRSAGRLGITRQGLYKMMRRLGINKDAEGSATTR